MSPFMGVAQVEDHYNTGLFRVAGRDARTLRLTFGLPLRGVAHRSEQLTGAARFCGRSLTAVARTKVSAGGECRSQSRLHQK